MSYVVNAPLLAALMRQWGDSVGQALSDICISQIAQSGHGNIRTLRRAWAFPCSPTRDSIASV
jgi:hypothetical protein